MSTIVTRATKGSALTWTEGDANITNLNNDKIEDIVEDLTPQLGGNLDVNGNSIVSTSNANINIEPDGSGKVVTSKTLNAAILASTQSAGDEGGQIELALAATNSVLTGSVAIDINQSQLRIFETGGSNRGVYINLANAATSVGTNLLAGSGGGLANIVEDLSPQLGGDLDVNGKNITSASNGNINITPNGSGNISLAPATGKIILGSVDWPTTGGTNGQVLTTNGTGTASWTTISSGGISNLVEDLSPQLGGALDVNGQQIVSASNGNIAIVPNGSGNIQLTPATGKITLGAVDWPTTAGTNGQVLTTNGTGTASWTTVSGGATTLNELTDVVITAAATNDVLRFDGTNWVDTALITVTVGAAAAINTIRDTTTNSTYYPMFATSDSGIGGGNVSLRQSTGLTFNPSTGLLTATAATFPTITLDDIRETVFAIGNSGTSTLTPNAANGSIQTITATGAFTLSSFTSPVSGQTITFIITQDATGSRVMSSAFKYAGGSKTLSTAANSIDILTVSYIGTTYYASLAKAFA